MMSTLILQMILYFNCCLALPWIVLQTYMVVSKFENLTLTYQFMSSFGSATLFTLELPRLYLGYTGNRQAKPAALIGFWLITILITLPIHSFLLFSPESHSSPLEIITNSIIFAFLAAESIVGTFALRRCVREAMKEYTVYPYLTPIESIAFSSLAKAY